MLFRSMKGLKSWEANEEKRSKHIIEKMLYMVEINNTNCEICKGLFGTQINLICSDFLDEIKFKTNKNKRYKYFLLQKVEKYQRQKICIQKI